MQMLGFMWPYLLVLATLLGSASALIPSYKLQGADWWGTCATGQRQSPIVLSKWTRGPEEHLITFYYNEPLTGANITDTQSTTMIEPKSKIAQRVLINGTDYYTVDHMEFHAPAEHRFENSISDLELQIVHSSKGTKRKTIVVFFFEDKKKSNPFLDDFLKFGFPANGESKQAECSDLGDTCLSIKSLLNKDGNRVFRYDGSMTTPGCSEIVTWIIVRDPLPANEEQLAAFKQQYKYPGTEGNWRVAPSLANPKASSLITEINELPAISSAHQSTMAVGMFAMLALPALF